MEFSQDNKVVQLCARGMELEGQGKLEEASKHFAEAWNHAVSHFEKFTAAHYVARHQSCVVDKLKWDKLALTHALHIKDESIKDMLPSLYLNIGKCYEDMNDWQEAKTNYQAAHSYTMHLPDNGYGNMIKSGIQKALDRTANR